MLLDAALKAYLKMAVAMPALFLPANTDDERKRIRLRALRQGWLLRRFYEGLPVPDAPTSPGENNRVLPPPHVRVPEEQFEPEKRTRRLYENDPLALDKEIPLLMAFRVDLPRPTELRELGMAIF